MIARSPARILVSGPLALLLSAGASAQLIVPLSQTRTADVSAELGLGGGPFDSDSAEALDLAPFSTAISAYVDDPAAGLIADAGAIQNSSITANRVRAQGSFNATAQGFFTEAETQQECSFEFAIGQTCRYELVGFVEAFDHGGTSFVLSRLGGEVVHRASAVGFSSVLPFDLAGTLQPGKYRLRILGGGHVIDGSPADYASGAYDVDLRVFLAGPADCVTSPNSSGASATLSMFGELAVASFDAGYQVTGGPPGHFGILFYGDAMTPIAFGSGVLCVSNPLYRVAPAQAFDAHGVVERGIPLGAPPMSSGPGQILPGSTWTFQFWFRDAPQPGGDAWNTSHGLTVTFAP